MSAATIPKNQFATHRTGRPLTPDEIRLDENRVLRWIIEEGGPYVEGTHRYSWPQIRDRCGLTKPRAGAALARLIKTYRVKPSLTMVRDPLKRWHKRLFLDWNRDDPIGQEIYTWTRTRVGTYGQPAALTPAAVARSSRAPVTAPPGRHRDPGDRVLETFLRNPGASWRDIAHALGYQFNVTTAAREDLIEDGHLVPQQIVAHGQQRTYTRMHYFPLETSRKVQELRKAIGRPWPGVDAFPGSALAWEASPLLRASLPEATRLRAVWDARVGKNLPTPSSGQQLAPLGTKLPTLAGTADDPEGDINPMDYGCTAEQAAMIAAYDAQEASTPIPAPATSERATVKPEAPPTTPASEPVRGPWGELPAITEAFARRAADEAKHPEKLAARRAIFVGYARTRPNEVELRVGHPNYFPEAIEALNAPRVEPPRVMITDDYTPPEMSEAPDEPGPLASLTWD